MSERRLGWSDPFAGDTVQTLQRVEPIDNISPDWAWGGSTGKGVKVAIIDSGVDASHPAVKSVSGYVAIKEDTNGKLVYETEPHEDVYGHGNACASIIRSIAPDVEIYSVKVLGAALMGRGQIFAAGLRWAIENSMDVCNLSLGTTKKDFFSTLHELADMAYFRNIMLVTAANNLAAPSFPSVYSSVIAVASHSSKDPQLFYYNSQPPVEFGAPGINVDVAWKGGSTITATGNSFAAPHISGVIARILGKHPELTVFQMKLILRALAANMAGNSV